MAVTKYWKKAFRYLVGNQLLKFHCLLDDLYKYSKS